MYFLSASLRVMVTVTSATLPPATVTLLPDWVPPVTEVTETVAPFRM